MPGQKNFLLAESLIPSPDKCTLLSFQTKSSRAAWGSVSPCHSWWWACHCLGYRYSSHPSNSLAVATLMICQWDCSPPIFQRSQCPSNKSHPLTQSWVLDIYDTSGGNTDAQPDYLGLKQFVILLRNRISWTKIWGRPLFTRNTSHVNVVGHQPLNHSFALLDCPSYQNPFLGKLSWTWHHSWQGSSWLLWCRSLPSWCINGELKVQRQMGCMTSYHIWMWLSHTSQYSLPRPHCLGPYIGPRYMPSRWLELHLSMLRHP